MIDDRTIASAPPPLVSEADTGPARSLDTAQSTLHGPTRPAPSDGPSPREPRAILPRIEGYEVQELLGRGGMGVVYKARHIELNRPVAIKMIRSAEDAGPEQRLRFSLEAETVARLQHANIVQLFHTGEHGGLPYLVMEFVGGGTLAERLSSRPQPLGEAVQLVESIARAVHVAHCHGIVHRDLKPANILLTADGTPKVADFGLARHLDREGQTQTGVIAGTVYYMAPEQAWGGSRLGEVGPAADIYALGVILYEALTGRPPFKSDSIQKTLEMVWTKEPPPPRSLRPDVPRDLETICLRCLHKDPARRYATAEHLAEDLRRYREHRPIQARPIGRGERLKLWCRRNPAAALFAAAAMLVFVLGAVGVTVKGYEAIQNADLADKQRKRAEGEKRVAEKERDEALDNLYSFLVVSAERALADDDLHLAADSLDQCPGPLRNIEWNLLDRRLRGSRLTLEGSLGPVTSAVYSPDEKTVATSSLRGPVRLWDAKSGKLLSELAVPAEAVAFTKGGERLVLLTARSDAMLDDKNGSWSVAWKPGHVEVWDVASRNRIHAFEPAAVSFALSGDNQLLAIGVDAKPPVVALFDFATGERLHTFELEGNTAEQWFWDAADVKFSPDDTRLLAVGLPADPEAPTGVKSAPAQMQLTLWDVESRERKLLVTFGEEANVLSVFGYGGSAFSPEGTYLVVHNAIDNTRLEGGAWKTDARPPLAFDLTTGEHTELTTFDVASEKRVPVKHHEPGTAAWEAEVASPLWYGGRQQHGSMAWSKDGRRIALSKGVSLQVFDARSGQLISSLPGHRDHILGLSFNADGTELLSAGGVDQLAKVWRPDRPAGAPWRLDLELLQQQFSMSAERQATFSPDSKTLAIGLETGEIQLYDVDSRKLLRVIPPPDREGEKALQEAEKFRHVHEIGVSHLAFTGPHELVAVYDERIVARYDLSGKTPRRLDLWDMAPLFEQGWASMTALDPRGGFFLAVSNREGDVGSVNPLVRVVDLRTHELAVSHEERGVKYASRGLAFSHAGRQAHFQGRSLTGEVIHRAWELPSGRPLAPGEEPVFAEDTFSPRGDRRVAVNSRGMPQLFNVDGGRTMLQLATTDDWCEWASFSPDGRWLLVAGNDGVSLFDTQRLSGTR